MSDEEQFVAENVQLMQENVSLRSERDYLRRVHADTVNLLKSAINGLNSTTRNN